MVRKALDPTSPKQVVFLLTLALLINYIDRGNLATAGPLLLNELKLSPTQLGTLLSAFYIAYAAAMVPAGWSAAQHAGNIRAHPHASGQRSARLRQWRYGLRISDRPRRRHICGRLADGASRLAPRIHTVWWPVSALALAVGSCPDQRADPSWQRRIDRGTAVSRHPSPASAVGCLAR